MNEGMFQSDLAAAIQPRILLKPESWLSKIDFINHLILFNNGLITILSEKRGGKSSFATLLQENLDPQVKALSITVRAPCNREQIIEDIAAQFHLKHHPETDISSLVAQINERRSHVLLLIDDAQHVPEVFIKEVMLAIKNQENFNFFHLCLISDYSIVGALNGLSASFFHDLVHTLEVGPLTEHEARTYTLQRAMATHLITKPLTEAQLKQFYQLTKGNVAKINNSLESFVFGLDNKKQSSLLDVVKKAGLPVGSAVLSGLVYLFLVKSYYEEPHATKVTMPAVQARNIVNLDKIPEVISSQIASWQDGATRELVDHSLAKQQDLDMLMKAVKSEVVAVADKASKSAQYKTMVNAKWQKRHSISYHQKQIIKEKIAQNNKKLYTIQLVASPDKVDMQRYLKSNKLLYTTAKLKHYTENHVVWYVLTIGEYGNMTDAKRSIAKLPPSLMKLNPWVRPVSSLG
ncbi:MAG: AAA family ATPase [Legionella sp.]|uniref:AAA family ATPase n=1 Tax=Legionella sp. TaxID=459 RepID=UPI0039E398BA